METDRLRHIQAIEVRQSVKAQQAIAGLRHLDGRPLTKANSRSAARVTFVNRSLPSVFFVPIVGCTNPYLIEHLREPEPGCFLAQ